MRVLVIDQECMGLDFALRCAHAGHEVKMYRHTPKRPERYGNGFKEITIVPHWRDQMAWVGKDGLVVPTGNFTLTHELDRYRDLGFKIFGPTRASARLEIDRLHGMRAAEAAGLAVPEYHLFNGLAETEAFARKSDKAWVFKPGDGAVENKALTYVSSDPADLVGWLRRQIKAGAALKQCMLQEKIEILSELGVSGWFGPDGCPPYYGVSIEHKKLMGGEVGPATGEQGTVCQWYESDKLADEMLLPLEPVLRTLGHRGDFSVGAIVDKAGKAWFLEVTARLGYPAWWIQMASMRGDPVQWMLDLLNGKDSIKVSYDVAIGVVCAQPPYPYNHDVPVAMVEGNPIQGVDEYPDQVHLASVMRAKGPVWQDGKIVEAPGYATTGPYVLVCTGLGKTIEKARAKVYRAVDAVRFPDKIFRDDIGCKVIEALPALHAAGYATEMAP